MLLWLQCNAVPTVQDVATVGSSCMFTIWFSYHWSSHCHLHLHFSYCNGHFKHTGHSSHKMGRCNAKRYNRHCTEHLVACTYARAYTFNPPFLLYEQRCQYFIFSLSHLLPNLLLLHVKQLWNILFWQIIKKCFGNTEILLDGWILPIILGVVALERVYNQRGHPV